MNPVRLGSRFMERDVLGARGVVTYMNLELFPCQKNTCSCSGGGVGACSVVVCGCSSQGVIMQTEKVFCHNSNHVGMVAVLAFVTCSVMGGDMVAVLASVATCSIMWAHMVAVQASFALGSSCWGSSTTGGCLVVTYVQPMSTYVQLNWLAAICQQHIASLLSTVP